MFSYLSRLSLPSMGESILEAYAVLFENDAGKKTRNFLRSYLPEPEGGWDSPALKPDGTPYVTATTNKEISWLELLETSLRNTFFNAPVLRLKFEPGVARIAYTELGFWPADAKDFRQEPKRLDARKMKALRNIVHEISISHVSDYTPDLSGMSFDELSAKFGRSANDRAAANDRSDNLSGHLAYQIEHVPTFAEAKKWSQYTDWCTTMSPSAWKQYTQGGRKFYVCHVPGFEKVKRVAGKGAPLDKYGKSLIAAVIDTDGNLDVCTCRWNHAHGGNDRVMTGAELSETLGVDYHDVLPPYTEAELAQRMESYATKVANGTPLNEIFAMVTECEWEGVKLCLLHDDSIGTDDYEEHYEHTEDEWCFVKDRQIMFSGRTFGLAETVDDKVAYAEIGYLNTDMGDSPEATRIWFLHPDGTMIEVFNIEHVRDDVETTGNFGVLGHIRNMYPLEGLPGIYSVDSDVSDGSGYGACGTYTLIMNAYGERMLTLDDMEYPKAVGNILFMSDGGPMYSIEQGENGKVSFEELDGYGLSLGESFLCYDASDNGMLITKDGDKVSFPGMTMVNERGRALRPGHWLVQCMFEGPNNKAEFFNMIREDGTTVFKEHQKRARCEIFNWTPGHFAIEMDDGWTLYDYSGKPLFKGARFIAPMNWDDNGKNGYYKIQMPDKSMRIITAKGKTVFRCDEVISTYGLNFIGLVAEPDPDNPTRKLLRVVGDKNHDISGPISHFSEADYYKVTRTDGTINFVDPKAQRLVLPEFVIPDTVHRVNGPAEGINRIDDEGWHPDLQQYINIAKAPSGKSYCFFRTGLTAKAVKPEDLR